MRLLGSSAFTSTSVPTLYISQSHRMRLPASKRPLLLVNQNCVVIDGSTNASKTSATGLRISSSALATTASRFISRTSLVCFAFQISLKVRQAADFSAHCPINHQLHEFMHPFGLVIQHKGLQKLMEPM